VSSEALAKEDWSFGGLRRTEGATGSCPWGSTAGWYGEDGKTTKFEEKV